MTFDLDIKPMFRDLDRRAMLYVLDLWSYDDVKANADNILLRMEDGSMPCDEPWAQDKLGFFRRWVEAGCPR